jgi:phosphonopyruvate decarboxylase
MDTCLFVELLYKNGFEYVIGVPCSFLAPIVKACILSKDVHYVGATQEGEALAISVGLFLSGKKSIILCQNSGLGNLVNPVTSLSTPYDIPFCIIMSYRGNGLINDEIHHHTMGEITIDLLKLLKVEVIEFEENDIHKHVNLINELFIYNKSSCLLFKKALPENDVDIKEQAVYTERKELLFSNNKTSKNAAFDQTDAMRIITNHFQDKALYVATTGMCSRILYHIHDMESNFYMYGSMGCASSIALGVSLNTKRKVVVFDGDGAFLMKMGNLATNAYYGRENFIHVLFRNNMYASTGGQTICPVNFSNIARASNYGSVQYVDNDIEEALLNLEELQGAHFIEIPVEISIGKTLSRPNITPEGIKTRFLNNVKNYVRKI